MSADEKTHGPRPPGPPETVVGPAADDRGIHDLTHKPVEIQASAGPPSGGVASLREFARALIEIGLADTAELERFAADSTEGVLGLSRALVKAGKLTPYQAAAVYQKKSRGLLIGEYLILDKVGQGGMGMVFKARHRKLGRVGALKILPPSFGRDRGAVMRFRREFEAAGRLKHLNLVAAFEADEDRGVHFIVMDYVEGINLDRVVDHQGPLPVAKAVDYLIQAARGLEAAHEQGIIHRDIKPGNLILDHGGTVRVLDLGLARIIDASNPFSKTGGARLTQSGTYMGTIDYMAPEQAEDAHEVDHRVDIYSLGCTLFFLLTGREPFSGGTILKRMVAHQEHAPPSLRAARPDVSLALEAVYQKMMAKRPDDRPASMNELIALLQASKLATDDVTAKEGLSLKARLECANDGKATLKRADTPRIAVDSTIFARGARSPGTSLDHELNLRDLVMDVRSEAVGPDIASAGDADRARGHGDQELSLRELAMELNEGAGPRGAPKPRFAESEPLKRSAATPHQGPPPVAPSNPSAEGRPLKRSVPTPPQDTPPAAPSSNPSQVRPPKRSASTPNQGTPLAEPKPSSAQVQPLKPGPLPTSPGPLSGYGLVIFAVGAAVLLLLAVAVFVSNRPPASTQNESRPKVVDPDASENAPDVDSAPPAP